MKKILKNVLIVIYAIIAIAVTICLLSFNEYRVSVLGDTSLVIIDSDELSPDYNKGDLVIVEKSNKIDIGDEVFFYNTYEQEISVSKSNIQDKEEITKTEVTYTLTGDVSLSGEFVIGKTDTSKVIPVLGTILGILESKWGFLFLIVLPSLLAFLYEIWEFIDEVKKSKK